MPKPETISAERLAAWTGLTDRRLRQIAQEGLIPPKTGEVWPMDATVTALFAYFKNRAEKSKEGINELKKEKLGEDIKKTRLEVARLEGRMVDVAELAEFLLKISTKSKIRLCQFLEKEFPARAGDAAEAAQRAVAGRELADEICDTMAREIADWNKELEAP